MQCDLCAYLEDILQAGSNIHSFTSGMTFEHYRESSLVRAAVERSFTIIGKALIKRSSTILSFDIGSITNRTSLIFAIASFTATSPSMMSWSGRRRGWACQS